jgi:hypothetical protein
MKTYIERDRIRLVAENENDNEAIIAIADVFGTNECPHGGTGERGLSDDCGSLRGQPLAYCCLPRPNRW